MIGIVLVGHGSLAPAVLRSIEGVLGHSVPNMVAVDFDRMRPGVPGAYGAAAPYGVDSRQ